MDGCTQHEDEAMLRVRDVWLRLKAQRVTQEQLGIKMGYDQKTARKSVSQFLKTKDPRLSMLRRFAKAAGVPLSELITE